MKRFLEGLILAGLFSLAEVAGGADIAYNAFWHAPWRWLFQILGMF